MSSVGLNHWTCGICKSYNDILTNHCRICQSDKPEWLSFEYQAVVELKRGIYLHRIKSYRIDGDIQNMTPDEELFKEFYNHEAILIKDMDLLTLREHREKMAHIAFEAKARLTKDDDEIRAKAASTKGKAWLVTSDDTINVSDAINAVKTRSVRMSKMDKLKKQLESAGIDDDTIKEMIGNMERKATDKNVQAITFNAGSKNGREIVAIVEKPEDAKPFDATNLKWG